MKKGTKLVIGGALAAMVGIIVGMIGCGVSPRYHAALRLPSQHGAVAATVGDRAGEGVEVPGQELWIIERRTQAPAATIDDKLPGTGSLLAKIPGSAEPVPVPLKHTDVKASVVGCITTVDVTQQYHNPYDTKIEAIYVFPLPHDAAVSDFVMTIGQRKIRGIIREREEARRIYDQAKQQGYVASLLTQERPNVFTQSVANIEPGKQIDVNIRYFNTLAYVDGWFEFVFPMVVGPRFNPPGSTDGVGAVERGAAGISGQKTEVQYLRPNERSGHDISLALDIDAGVPIENILCRSHRIQSRVEGTRASISLADEDRIPNKDFVLRYQVAGKTARTAIFAQRDRSGGYFAMMLVPPIDTTDIPRQPLQMVFTMDVSGSMNGRPIEQSKAAVRYALRHMNPADSVQVIRFENTAQRLFSNPMPANAGNVQRALDYVDRMHGGGGTMMAEGIRASLRFPHDESRLRYVAFLTDGFIGNEPEVLREIHDNLGPSRIFSFGVGSSPNRYLLEHMAKMGSGAAAFVNLSDPPDEAMAAFLDRISRPALTNISVDFGALGARAVYPQRVPDLFVGRPVMIFGRCDGGNRATVKISGILGGRPREISVPVDLDKAAKHEAIPLLWARAKIADLMDTATWHASDELMGQVKQVALEYGLMSQFTEFIAVDSSQRTAGDHGVTVGVPVPVPDGVRYETTVQEKNPRKREPEKSTNEHE